MSKIYLLTVDSTLKTFSVVDGGVSVRYEKNEQFNGVELKEDDILLGLVTQGVNEFRSSYRVLSVDDDGIELEKEIERSSGVSVDTFMPQLSSALSGLLGGAEIVGIDQGVAEKIHSDLLGTSVAVSSVPEVDVLSVALKLFQRQRAGSGGLGSEPSANGGAERGGPNGWASYDAWAKAARETFAKVDAGMLIAADFDYAGFARKFVYNPTVANVYFKDHDANEKTEVGNFISQNRQTPKAASWYIEKDNLPKVKGLKSGVALNFMMKVRPNEFVTYSPKIDKALMSVGLLAKPLPDEPTVESYEQSKALQGRVLAKMHELHIGKAADDESAADYLTVNEFAWWLSDEKNQNLIKEKVMAATYKKTEIKKVTQTEIKDFSDFIKKLEKDVADAGLKYAPDLMKRFVCAQLAKPFVVLTGLSGSGKTKLAEAFTKWIGVENTVNIVPVGADWTNNEKLLGYPNALDPDNYVMPDTGVLKLMLDANENPDLPFFLILDEMNLSHVERYFADFLSTMESTDGIIELYDSGKRFAEDGREIPPSFPFPKNLFVIGTMNVDETTYMFSPKVLDRAQVIEFRVSEKEMTDFLAAPGNPKIDELAGKGAAYAKAFLDLAKERKTKDIGADEKKKFNELLIGKVNPKTKELDGLFTALAKLGAEFGYRSAIEMVIFIAYYLEASAYGGLKQFVDKEKCLKDAIDAAVLQKLLPKLHGSLNRLGPVIDALISKVTITQTDQNGDSDTTQSYPLTCEKLLRMKDRVEKNGFTSFAEA